MHKEPKFDDCIKKQANLQIPKDEKNSSLKENLVVFKKNHKESKRKGSNRSEYRSFEIPREQNPSETISEEELWTKKSIATGHSQSNNSPHSKINSSCGNIPLVNSRGSSSRKQANLKINISEREYNSQSTIDTSLLNLSQDKLDFVYPPAELAIKEQQDKLDCLLNPNYLNYQCFFNHEKRFILIEWLMQVSSMSLYSKQTLYLSVVLFDIYLSSQVEIVNNNRIQLIGLTCLVIAAKFEEKQTLHLENYSQLTDDSYSVEQIIDCELTILKALNWNINYPSLASWANLITSKWDAFADSFEGGRMIERKLLRFRRGRFWFDYLFYILDLVITDIECMILTPMTSICALIYLLCGLDGKDFGMDAIMCLSSSTDPNVISALLNNYTELNFVMNCFLSGTFNLSLSCIIECISLVSSYFLVKFQHPMENVK